MCIHGGNEANIDNSKVKLVVLRIILAFYTTLYKAML